MKGLIRNPEARHTALAVIAILLLAVVGMGMLRAATPFGLGLNTDSVYYVDGARNLLAGNGFARTSGENTLKPLTHFPPLFSIVLAGVGLSGLDPLRGGRLVIILLYGLDAILAAGLAWRLTRSRWLAVLAAALMVFSAVNLRQFSWLMSEPLYLAWLLAGFLAAAWYWQVRTRTSLVVLGVLAGMMYLTRYIGASFLLTILAMLVLFEKSWRERLRRCGILLLASLPWMLWAMIRNYWLTGSTGNRSFNIHWASLDKLAQGARSAWGWLLPSGSQGVYERFAPFLVGMTLVFLAAGLAILARSLWVALRSEAIGPVSATLLAMGVHIFIYLFLVLVTMNFFDATTVLDERMLLPLYVLLLVLALVVIGRLWRAAKMPARIGIAVGAVFILMLAAVNVRITMLDLSQDGQGYSDHFRRDSQTMAYLREHDVSVFYTNQPPQVYIQTGKAGYMVPSPVDSLTLQARAAYQQDLVAMQEKITRGDGLLVFFFEPGFESDPWYLALTAGLEPKVRFPDAILWGRIE